MCVCVREREREREREKKLHDFIHAYMEIVSKQINHVENSDIAGFCFIVVFLQNVSVTSVSGQVTICLTGDLAFHANSLRWWLSHKSLHLKSVEVI